MSLLAKILVIDDKYDNLISAQAVIKSNLPDYQVLLAESGKKGIQLVKEEKPDVILLDINMPGLNGFEVCQILKQSPETSFIPIIFLTAQNCNPEHKIMGLEIGADAFLTKPIDNYELITQIKVMVRIKRAEDELRKKLKISNRTILEKEEKLNLAEETNLGLKKELTEGFIQLDNNLRIVEVNRVGQELFTNPDMEKFCGSHISVLFPDLIDDEMRNNITDVIETGIPYTIPNYLRKTENQNQHYDIKIFGIKGNPAMMVKDITDKIKAINDLNESEEKYRLLFENMVNGCAYNKVIFDRDGKIKDYVFLEVNRSFLDLTGVKDNIIGKKGSELFTDINSEASNLFSIFCDVALTGKPQKLECYFEAMSKWYSISIYSPEKYYFVTIFEDITESKLISEELKESQKQLSMLNRITEVFLTHPDDEMYPKVLDIVMEVLESKHGLFGYIDNNSNLVVPAYSKEIIKTSEDTDNDMIFPRKNWRGMWGRTMNEKRTLFQNSPFQVPEGHQEINKALSVPIVHRGKLIGIFTLANREKNYSENDAYLMEQISDHVAPILFSRLQKSQEESERILAQKALMESEKKYRSLIEQSNDAIYLLVDNKFKLVNNKFTEMFKISRDEVYQDGFKFTSLVSPKSLDYINERTKLLEQGENIPDQYQFIAMTKDNKEIEVEVSVAHLLLDNKPSTHGIIRNISTRKELERKFYQAQKMETVGRLAGGIAHDFNNLLTVIGGNAELALMMIKEDDRFYDEFKEILETSNRAANLTRQLLAFSKKQLIQPKVFNINMVLKDMNKMLNRLIGEDIELKLIEGTDVGNINADPSQIEQIIINLVVNARDAMPEGGNIIIETDNIVFDEQYASKHPGCRAEPYVQIQVSDTGTGIPEEIRNHIFEPFFTTKDEKGTGLGLATVFGIIKNYGGYIDFYSEPGSGTTFKIYFPLCLKEDIDNIFSNNYKLNLYGNEEILVVEDDLSVRDFAVRSLQKYGYQVSEASSGFEALKIIRERKKTYELVLTDIIMPKMNGIDLAAIIREKYSNIKVLYMSGYPYDIIKNKGIIDNEVDFLINKPFSASSLTMKIRSIFDKDNPIDNEIDQLTLKTNKDKLFRGMSPV